MSFNRTGSRELLLICCIATCFAGAAQPAAATEKTLHNFKGGSDGVAPYAPVIDDSAGNLYGTTYGGGGGTDCRASLQGCGTVYRISKDGTETVLHAFAGGCDGAYPHSGLVSDASGNMYGTTQTGGTCNSEDGFGTVYKIAPDGTESVLYAFQNNGDGLIPSGGLALDSVGNLYGTASDGSTCGSFGCGVVFEVTPQGAETVLYAFQGGSDGAGPFGGVIRDNAGNLYGTTFTGGGTGCNGFGCGTVFKLAPNGTESVLYAFQGGSDGEAPTTGVVEDSAGNFYGTTIAGGTGVEGTVFKVAPNGTETVLYSFLESGGGYAPQAGVILDGAGNLYGTTFDGGDAHCHGGGCGVVFKLTPDGTETVLHVFGKTLHGHHPAAGVLLGKHGILYGTTLNGGSKRDGIVFEIKQ